jgi:hypothetical protein
MLAWTAVPCVCIVRLICTLLSSLLFLTFCRCNRMRAPVTLQDSCIVGLLGRPGEPGNVLDAMLTKASGATLLFDPDRTDANQTGKLIGAGSSAAYAAAWASIALPVLSSVCLCACVPVCLCACVPVRLSVCFVQR